MGSVNYMKTTNHETTIEPSYPERAAAMTEQEHAELRDCLKMLARNLATIMKSVVKDKTLGVNIAREIGQQVELFTGREKLALNGFEAMAPAIREGLPDATLEFAKRCLFLHQRYPDEIRDVRLALAEWDSIEQLLLNLPSATHGNQKPHPHEPVKDFISQVVRVRGFYTDLAQEAPLEKWSPFFRTAFIREAQPIVDLVEKAKKMQED